MKNIKEPKHRQYDPVCPCGSRGVLWIGSVPSCEPCMEKDRIYKEGLDKWHAFHLQRQFEMGEVVDVSGMEVEHVQTHREDGE